MCIVLDTHMGRLALMVISPGNWEFLQTNSNFLEFKVDDSLNIISDKLEELFY